MIADKKGIAVSLLIVIGALVNSIPRWVHGIMICGRKAYYMGDALSIFLFLLAARIVGNNSKVVKITLEFTLILAFSNLSDEVVGDPLSFGTNEKVFAVVSVIWLIFRVAKSKCLKQRPITMQ